MLVPALAACGSPERGLAVEGSVAIGMPAPMWDTVFARTRGWTGGDAIYSVDLGGGRTLWLFGDTWIGSIVDGKHAPGSRLVNNTIAVHATPPGRTDRPPSADQITFHWGPDDAQGRPTAWISPGAKSAGWYWPLDGVVVPPTSTRGARLVLFLAHIVKRPGDHGVWGFKGAGGVVAIVDNPNAPVEAWRIARHANPHAVGTDRPPPDPALSEMSWGAAVLHASSDGPGSQGYLYIYGVKETAKFYKQLLLARAPGDDVLRFDRWRFHTADGGWSPNLTDAHPVADHVANELSVERVSIAGRPTLIMVHSEAVFGDRILVRLADSPAGPWSKPAPVYRVPGVKRAASYFTYAGKGHAHLSAEGELLVSYVINAHDFGAMIADAEIYRPRFIRVRLDRLTQARRSDRQPLSTQPRR